MILYINGEIVGTEWQWLYDWFAIPAVSPGRVREGLAGLGQGEEVTVEINSPGGSVFAGFEIYSILRGLGDRVTAHVQSLAGSAASTVMAGCARVLLSPVAQVMIHLPAVDSGGDAPEHRHTADVLDAITQSILEGYLSRPGIRADRETLRALMEEETWLPAPRAVELGLADGILGEGSPSPAQVVNALGGASRPGELLARYEALVRAGRAAPAEGHPVDPGPGNQNWDDWRARARLDIERNRYIHI